MSVADTSVQHYLSAMSGAPSLTGSAGSIISLIDTCITGFGTVTLASLTIAGNVATGVVSTGHGFAMTDGKCGPVIAIAGATPSGLNGKWRIASIPNSTTFTFTTSGINDQTASGTITAKIAGLSGWSKLYSGTNLAVYQRTTSGATAMLMSIDDTNAAYAIVTMYEAMSGVSIGTGASGVVYLTKSINGDSRPYRLFANGKTLHLFTNNDSAAWYGNTTFGDINSYVNNDAYGCLLIGAASPAYPTGGSIVQVNGDTSAAYLSRAYSQLGTAIACGRYSHRRSAICGDGGIMNLSPNPVSNKIHLWPIECWDATSYARGLIPGLYNPLNALSDGAVISGVNGNPALYQALSIYRIIVDMVGPW